MYSLIALAARYWFAGLIVVILFRGWRMTVADNRRARLLRGWMGQTRWRIGPRITQHLARAPNG